MTSTPQVQSGSRPGRLARSRSQRVAHVIQTSKDKGIISTVNDDQNDDHSEFSTCLEQSFSFLDLRDEKYDRDEIDDLASEIRKDFNDDEDGFPESELITNSRDIVVVDDSPPVFFDANTDDGSVYSFYPAEEEDDHQKGASVDLFSDDEFAAINMNFQRRPKNPVRLPSRINVHVNKSLPPSPRTSHYEHSTYEESLFSVEAESTSCSTLYSMGSSATSATCVSQDQLAKAGNRNTEFSHNMAPRKCLDVAVPALEMGFCNEISLEKIGYGFGSNRFDPRNKAMRDMTSDPINFEQYALSRGPNAFPVPGASRPKLRSTRSNLEKRLLGVFKQKRVA